MPFRLPQLSKLGQMHSLTNDKKLKKVEEIKVMVLKDYLQEQGKKDCREIKGLKD